MKKEALKKKFLLLRNRIAKFDNAIHHGLERLKPWVWFKSHRCKPSRMDLHRLS